MTDSTDLRDRLAAMESRIPTADTPELARPRRLPRVASLALAPALLVVLATTAVAGGAIVAGLAARGAPGVENPGQPLAGANLECMSPPQAAAYLADHGFPTVTWQVETGGADGRSGTSTQVAIAPAHGYVVPGSIIDGRLIMVIDQRAGATGTGACPDLPMP